jgi:hypothetical protein
MKRWTTWVWQALIGLGEVEFPVWNEGVRDGEVELTDDVVRAVFRELVEREWGTDAARR